MYFRYTNIGKTLRARMTPQNETHMDVISMQLYKDLVG
jgi:hypothetical protein